MHDSVKTICSAVSEKSPGTEGSSSSIGGLLQKEGKKEGGVRASRGKRSFGARCCGGGGGGGGGGSSVSSPKPGRGALARQLALLPFCFSTTASRGGMEAIKQLKELYDEGLMTKEEYDERRLQVINDMTLTEYDVRRRLGMGCCRTLRPRSCAGRGQAQGRGGAAHG